MYPYLPIFNRQIPTYGICITVGLVLCYLCAHRRAKLAHLSTDHLLIIGASGFGCAMLGAKILYLFVSFSPSELMQIIISGNLNAILERGFVFYGGLLGGIAGAWIGSRIAGTSLLSFESAIIPYLPLGYGIGRIGCFLAGCCYGISFSNFIFPVQLLDAVLNFLLCGILVKCSHIRRPPLQLLLIYLSIYAAKRFLIEFLRGDSIRGLFFHLSTSQWISLALLLLSSIFLYRQIVHKR